MWESIYEKKKLHHLLLSFKQFEIFKYFLTGSTCTFLG